MSTSTLTERYVSEVVRRIPADQRDDVAAELRATIADTVEARDGADPKSAEREVLIEMGDPIRLAAGYADRPPVLIGPELYPAYMRILMILLTAVLPAVTALVVAIDIIDGKGFGAVIGTAIGVVVSAGAQMIAWLTAVFALVERSRYRKGAIAGVDTWTPDDLPEVPTRDKGGVSACVAAVWNALLIGLIVWQRTAASSAGDGGGNIDRVQVIDPVLWSGWIWPVLVGLAGIVVFNLVRVAVGRWSVPLLVGYTGAEILFAVPLVWILTQHLFFNPDFLTVVNNGNALPDGFYSVSALVVLVVSASAVYTRFREARK